MIKLYQMIRNSGIDRWAAILLVLVYPLIYIYNKISDWRKRDN